MQLPNSLSINRVELSGGVASITRQLMSAERAWLGVYPVSRIPP